MILRIFVKSFRCLRGVDVRLKGAFHLLVGPNGSGKSSLIDAIGLLSDLTSLTLREAIDKRTRNFRDLVWAPSQQQEPAFSLGMELDVEALLKNELEKPETSRLEYSIALADDENDGVHIRSEIVQLVREGAPTVRFQRNKNRTEYRIGSKRMAPVHHGDDSMFHFIAAMLRYGPFHNRPLTKAFDGLRRLLGHRVKHLFLDSRRLREPCSSIARGLQYLKADGSNLPWIVRQLRNGHRKRFDAWLSHLRTTLHDIQDVRVTETEESREAYIKVRYASGVEVPAWCISDGTLRLMALTLLAYLPNDESHIFMIEEPENGLHPLAIETAYQSLSSIYDSHVLLASHSPLLLRCAEPSEVLCFGQAQDGSTKVVHGKEHPSMSDWRSVTDNDLLFAHRVSG